MRTPSLWRLWVLGLSLSLANVTSCGDSTDGTTNGGAGSSADAGKSSSAGSKGSGGSATHGGSAGSGGPGAGGEMSTGNGGTAAVSGSAGAADAGAPAVTGGAPAGGSPAQGTAGEVTAGAVGDGGAGGAAPELPSCDDGKAATDDFYSALYGCGHLTDALPGGGDGWISYDAGFYVDEKTGSAWVLAIAQGSLEAAQTYCDGLVVGSVVDWRVPIIDEVRSSFAGLCPATAPSGSCPIHDPSNLSSAEIYSAACESCIGGTGIPYCSANAPACPYVKTSSICSDCVGTKGWTYGPINGNFNASDVGNTAGIACVIPNLPDGVP